MLRDAESKLTLLAPESSPRVPWVAKIFGPAKPLLSRVGDRQPELQTLVVPQRQCLWLVVDLPLHRSLPPTRGTTTQPILYHTLLMLGRAPGVGTCLFTQLSGKQSLRNWLHRELRARMERRWC